ncbi:hypothetical protein NDU88_002668 [Pleurodeles waltl]|uniref:Uncharacterized protein n=1 Tax=Pleurodeles waltl TaxID=8319 RepID=A0AAV7T3G6_PLEWA|nr:hypothetical protein NDU88_002668 [Pleurodeles waltl]
MRTLNTTPARPALPAPGGYQLATGITPQTIHTIMVKDAPDRRGERGGLPDRRPEYVKQKKDLPQSTIKKEDRTPQQKPQFKKKKEAALSAKNASTLEKTVEEQDVGSDTVRQRSRSHDMSPESERSSGCDSN